MPAVGCKATEVIPSGNKTDEPRRYGIYAWSDMFSPRQLLALCSYVEALHELIPEIEKELPQDRAKAVVTYLGMVLSKAVNYNSRLTVWHPTRSQIANTFNRHDFAFCWTYGEFDASRNLFPWALDQVCDAYKGIAKLAEPAHRVFRQTEMPIPVQVTRASASDLSHIPDGSIDLVLTDPPYYDNVMYGELSDFFYVWFKRTLAAVHPDLFADDLANKDDEAVANPARFARMGRKKKQLAAADYERKMAASFREARRVLTDDGVLTVMFTHKKVEAWDTLAMSLLEAGFAIRSSWPVHTESEHSLHQAKKNAAKSTILLTCRKRPANAESAWWDDIRGRVRRTARETAEELQKQGISGVDLYIATFGPTLAILSESWPVLTSEVDEKTGGPKRLRPDVALDLARSEVVDLPQARPARTRHALRPRHRLVPDGVGRLQGRRVPGRRGAEAGPSTRPRPGTGSRRGEPDPQEEGSQRLAPGPVRASRQGPGGPGFGDIQRLDRCRPHCDAALERRRGGRRRSLPEEDRTAS